MKYFIVPLLFVLGSTATLAQTCTEAELAEVPGVWKPAIKGTINLTGANLEKAKSITAIADNMMRPGFQVPKGLVATYFAAFMGFNKYIGNDLAQYDYTNWFNHYMCYNNKPRENPSSQIILSITFNHPDVVFTHDAIVGEWEENEKDHFGWLDNFPVQKNGIIYMKAMPDSAHFTRKPDRWLLTYDGKLPYAYVTRLEYLQKLKVKLTKLIQKGITDIKQNNPIRPKAEQDKEKEDQLKKYKEDAANGRGDWTNQYLRNYRTDEQKQDENIKALTEMYKNPLQRVEDFLKMPEKELQKPAIIINNGEFQNFLNEGEPGAVILVKENPDYYNKKLAKAVPQVIFVSLTRYNDSKKANYVAVYNEIVKRLDLQKLLAMLGKEPSNPIVKNQPESKPAIIPKKENEKILPEFDVYKKTPTAGFTPTNAASIISEPYAFAAIDPAVKLKAINKRVTEQDLPEYIKRLLTEIEKKLNRQQKENTNKIFEKLKNDPIGLADAGVMLYCKNAVSESLWCLAKAASLKPGSNYILNNLSGTLNLADAPVWSLPVLRYLNDLEPQNTTILNNLGQALFALGDISSSKAVLDSCIRICAFHSQANTTRAVIADKEGKKEESVKFIENSLKGTYNDNTAAYADRRKIKIDYPKILNRYRPTSAEYINPRKFMPPPQCTNVFLSAVLEAEWKEWRERTAFITDKIDAGLETSAANYSGAAEKVIKTGNPSAFLSFGPLCFKADKLYKAYLAQVVEMQLEAQAFYDKNYTNTKRTVEKQHHDRVVVINKKYEKNSGEGKGNSESYCSEMNAANSAYLQSLATLNDDFNARFAEPMRRLRIEMMYWSEFLPMNAGIREGMYYENAMYAVKPFQIESIFIPSCDDNKKATAEAKPEEPLAPNCPISFRFKIAIVKLTGDCNKLDIEFEIKGLVLNLEKDFITKNATIAFGVGASVNFEKDFVPQLVQAIVEIGGGGVGAKMQGFIEMSGKGFSDLGIRGEAGIEGVATDKGDIKISGKFGVNSGADISATPYVHEIGKALTGSFAK